MSRPTPGVPSAIHETRTENPRRPIPARTTPKLRDRLRPRLLQCYRLGVLLAIVWLARDLHVWIAARGDRPIQVEELSGLLPGAARLVPDGSEKQGQFVQDMAGQTIGYVARTSPLCDDRIGYIGPTDTMIVMRPDYEVIAMRIRRTWDTPSHLEVILRDNYFMNTFNGKRWREVAEIDFYEEIVEGVSGATMTSMNIAENVRDRFRHSLQLESDRPPIRFGQRDAGLAAVVLAAGLFSFTRLRGRKWPRRAFQVAVIAYVGFYCGDLVAQSLLAGWTIHGVAWRAAPGLALLVAAAFVFPWATRRPVYCSQICPHGLAQELVGRAVPWKISLPGSLARPLKWLPPLLLGISLAYIMLGLPVDLAGIEAFDAYLLHAAAWPTIAIAVAGLAAAAFIPQAYCKYGCPTGSLLEFVRSHGRADRFGRSDLVAAGFLGVALLCYWKYEPIHHWLLVGH